MIEHSMSKVVLVFLLTVHTAVEFGNSCYVIDCPLAGKRSSAPEEISADQLQYPQRKVRASCQSTMLQGELSNIHVSNICLIICLISVEPQLEKLRVRSFGRRMTCIRRAIGPKRNAIERSTQLRNGDQQTAERSFSGFCLYGAFLVKLYFF